MSLIALMSGAFVVALLTEAFERGAGRRFPEWDRFLLLVAWILTGVLVAIFLVTVFFLALGAWG